MSAAITTYVHCTDPISLAGVVAQLRARPEVRVVEAGRGPRGRGRRRGRPARRGHRPGGPGDRPRRPTPDRAGRHEHRRGRPRRRRRDRGRRPAAAHRRDRRRSRPCHHPGGRRRGRGAARPPGPAARAGRAAAASGCWRRAASRSAASARARPRCSAWSPRGTTPPRSPRRCAAASGRSRTCCTTSRPGSSSRTGPTPSPTPCARDSSDPVPDNGSGLPDRAAAPLLAGRSGTRWGRAPAGARLRR